MDYDEGVAIHEPCPNCQSRATEFDAVFGFWKCEDCSTVWGHDKDDPDWDDEFLNNEPNDLGISPRG